MASLPIDINDPEDIEAKLPRVRGERERAAGEVARATDALGALDSLIAALEARLRLAGRPAATATEDRPQRSRPRTRSAQATVTQIVNDRDAPMDVGEVAAQPATRSFKRKTIGWALWKAASQGELLSLGDGGYAPLSYAQRVQELTPPTTEASKK